MFSYEPIPSSTLHLLQAKDFTRDGVYAFSGGDDSRLKLWVVASGEEKTAVTLDASVFCMATSVDNYIVLGTRST